MTIEQAREWLRRHADNTPMPGARNRVEINTVRKGCKLWPIGYQR